ncbi:MFS transporter [Streptomyces sp. HYC2]|uniref:MFS transporter n=1 Tax=Streptomyces sp. HYC2 TaxID=2955207 RepID=UPI00248174C9|nr:MFS transporter [Streptomyces sp. HYC2]
MRVIVDANQAFTAAEAVRRAALLEPYDVGWFEEPLPAGDAAGHERLAAATTVPVAVGKSMYSFGHFREVPAARGRKDRAARCGTDRWHHTLAEGHPSCGGLNVDVCPHFLMEIHVSLTAAIPNARYVEYISQLRAVTARQLRIADGLEHAPSEPSLGIAWDRDAFDDRRVACPAPRSLAYTQYDTGPVPLSVPALRRTTMFTLTTVKPVHTAAAHRRRVLLASLVGSALEWYDFYLYGAAAALVLNKIIFPSFDSTASLLASFGTLAVGYFVRPLGGVIFGRMGDLFGRKRVLVLTLLVMGSSTVGMALVPTYEQVGALAPILLVVLRAIQGLGAGAEYGGAAVLAVEFSEPRRRGLFGAAPGAGVYIGILMASGAFALATQLPEDQFLAWGWRIPFAASVVVIGVALLIRLRLAESPAFKAAQERSKTAEVSPVRDVVRHEWKAGLVVFGLQAAQCVVAYLNLTFLTAYLTDTLQLSSSTGPVAVTVGTAVTAVSLPLFGRLTDRIGRKPVALAGTLFSAVFAFPYFWVIDHVHTSLAVTLVVVVSMGIGVGCMFAPQAAYFSELFTARSRFTGLALYREVAGAVAGGLTPLIAIALVAAAGDRSWGVALFVIGSCVVGGASVALGPETRGRDLAATTVTELRASTGTYR